jgi:5-oxoprolinase (ATP-hydrolysing) subunit A
MLINVDCGEELNEYSKQHDDDIVPYCDLINLACGGHAGSHKTMKHCIELAKESKTLVGAHPSFNDKYNFGRVVVDISYQDLVRDIHHQIKVIADMCKEYGVKMYHIKPHGALYNIACQNEEYASAIVKAIKKLNDPKVKLLCPQKSMLAMIAEGEFINLMYEVFADRRYTDDASLVSRQKEGAVLHDVMEIQEQYHNLQQGFVISENKNKVFINGDTVCVHGEHKRIKEILVGMKDN